MKVLCYIQEFVNIWVSYLINQTFIKNLTITYFLYLHVLKYPLQQKLANFFYKGPDNKYSRFFGPLGLFNCSTLLLKLDNSHTGYLKNEHG